jgi:crotonobetainyl-CoA:carnitine CoA-transferase CaiB-like acyl-CoA transferase
VSGLLDGLRVVDLTDERGLVAGRVLADLGADVVQVEPPQGSRARRCVPRTPDGTGSFVFDTFAANKRGIVIDTGSVGGVGLLRDLARRADVLLESADAGALLPGLDVADLARVNPRLIHVSITAFGRTWAFNHFGDDHCPGPGRRSRNGPRAGDTRGVEREHDGRHGGTGQGRDRPAAAIGVIAAMRSTMPIGDTRTRP